MYISTGENTVKYCKTLAKSALIIIIKLCFRGLPSGTISQENRIYMRFFLCFSCVWCAFSGYSVKLLRYASSPARLTRNIYSRLAHGMGLPLSAVFGT